MIKNILIICLLVFALSCNSEKNKPTQTSLTENYKESSDLLYSIKYSSGTSNSFDKVLKFKVHNAIQTQNDSQNITKKIIKEGDITLLTNNISETKNIINKICIKTNSYYEGEYYGKDKYNTYYRLRIKVPADKFEDFVSSLDNGDYEVQDKTIKSEDITLNYYDLETRLNTKRAYLKKYLELLSKANAIKDVLEIQSQIHYLQEDIESADKNFKIMKDEVAFSSLEVILRKKHEFVYKPGQQDNIFERVKKSLHNGWISIIDFLIWSITLWPFMILTIVVILIFKRIRKKRRNRN